jgi:hypothetical protein
VFLQEARLDDGAIRRVETINRGPNVSSMHIGDRQVFGRSGGELLRLIDESSDGGLVPTSSAALVQCLIANDGEKPRRKVPARIESGE